VKYDWVLVGLPVYKKVFLKKWDVVFFPLSIFSAFNLKPNDTIPIVITEYIITT